MIRNLKALGLALVAVFALGAMLASAASAQETTGKITSTGPVTLDAEEIPEVTNAFTYGPGFQLIECPGSKLTGHKTLLESETTHEEITTGIHTQLIPSGSDSATITPHYSGCHAVNEGGGETHKATVTMNGCDYDLKVLETTGVGEDTYGVKAAVVCPPEKFIDIHVYPFAGSELGGVACTIKITPEKNQDLTGPHLTGITTGTHDLELRGTFTGIHAEKTGICGEGTTNAAELHVGYTIKGTNAEGGDTEITVSH